MLLTSVDSSKTLLAAMVHDRGGPSAGNLAAATVSCPCPKPRPSKPAALSCAPARGHRAHGPAGSCRPAARWPERPTACSRYHRSEQLHKSQAVSVTPIPTGSTHLSRCLPQHTGGHLVSKGATPCGHPELNVLLLAFPSLMQQVIQLKHSTSPDMQAHSSLAASVAACIVSLFCCFANSAFCTSSCRLVAATASDCI